MDRLSNYPGKTVPPTSPGKSGTTVYLSHQLATVAWCVTQTVADPPEDCCSLTVVPLQIHARKTEKEKGHRGLIYGLSLCPPLPLKQVSLEVTVFLYLLCSGVTNLNHNTPYSCRAGPETHLLPLLCVFPMIKTSSSAQFRCLWSAQTLPRLCVRSQTCHSRWLILSSTRTRIPPQATSASQQV